MGWKSDWLYAVVFKMADAVVDKARNDARQLAKASPITWVLAEYSQADWNFPVCGGPVMRTWTKSQCDWQETPEILDVAPPRSKLADFCYPTALISFHVAEDRKRVVLNYSVGPRYAGGRIYRVSGQGIRGKLTPADGPSWIS